MAVALKMLARICGAGNLHGVIRQNGWIACKAAGHDGSTELLRWTQLATECLDEKLVVLQIQFVWQELLYFAFI